MIAPLPDPGIDRQARIPHVPALDGLRGLAVIGVLLFHAGHLQGGFLGVDLFFTLSGFLITSLLLVEQERTGRISLGAFWARRARRLLPAMLAVVAASAVVAEAVLPTDQMRRFGEQAIATLFYVANWGEIARSSDYWALFDSPTPLEHVWSLAIEEQFYVVWPLLVWAATRRLGPRVGVGTLVGLGLLGSVVASVVLLEGGGAITRAYYGTDTRAASILVGAALAVGTTSRPRRPSGAEQGVALAALGSVLVLVASWFAFDGAERWLYPWGLLLHAVLTALVIAAVTGPLPGRLARVLASRALVRTGVLSYGLYLWHWPVYVVLDEDRIGSDGWSLTALRLAVSLAIATASFHWLEAPIRHQRWRFRRPGLVALGSMAATSAIVVAIAWFPTAADGDRAADVASGPSDEVSAPDGRLLVVGDSGPATIARELESAGRSRGLDLRVEAQVGCGLVGPGVGDGVHVDGGGFYPDPEGCPDWPRRWADLVASQRPDAVLLMLAWGGGGDRELEDGARRGPCDPAYDRYYERQVAHAVEVLGAGGAVVTVATTPPHAFERSLDRRTTCLNQIYRRVAERDGARVLDLRAWTCGREGACADRPDPDRPDGTHFAGDGAVRAARWIVEETSRLAGLDGLPFAVLVGDSQAFRLVEHAPRPAEIGLRLGSVASLGCGLSAQTVVVDGDVTGKAQCAEVLAGLPDAIDELDPDAVVVHAGAWEALDVVTDDGRVAFGDPRWERRLRSAVASTLERISDGERTLIALTTPCFADGPGRDAFGTADLDARLRAYNEVLAEETRRLGGAVVDLASQLCPLGTPVAVVDDVTVRPDGVHTDRAGARALWSTLAPQLRDALRPRPAAG